MCTIVRIYANINCATINRQPEGFSATALRAANVGFKASKAAPFDGVTPSNCSTALGQELIYRSTPSAKGKLTTPSKVDSVTNPAT